MKKIGLFLLFPLIIFSQNLDLNENFYQKYLRFENLSKGLNKNLSFTLRPLNEKSLDLSQSDHSVYQDISQEILTNKSKSFELKVFPIKYNIEYNSETPYNRNNGTMIPNVGYQHLISFGLYSKIGPLTITLRPEHHFSENKNFQGFWEGHSPIIWAKRYILWNRIDMPERFGNKRHNSLLLGQSSIKFNYKNFSFGISNENLWWGPSIKNSIMMSNHSQGFKHITFNTNKPIKTKIGNFEWQLITGRLESSGYTPPNTNVEYAGNKLYVAKINQLAETDDWRFLQAYIITFSPKFLSNLSVGFMRWTQMYSSLVEGKYWWMKGNTTYFPVFNNLFRSNDKYGDFEGQTNQAAGVFFRWLWEDSNAEIYAEFHHNDSKFNFRDLILDSEHSRAVTFGIQKVFNSNLLFSWEWTQLEQSSSRITRDAGSWYMHYQVYDGYTNRGEVLGAGIGPGSNSQFFSIQKFNKNNLFGLALEIIDNDNDFYYEAFASEQDFRRYWKDFNFQINFEKKFKSFLMESKLIFQRQLNYQWGLTENATSYYLPGRDINNLHFNLKFIYFFKL
jgi:hypothetical protein